MSALNQKETADLDEVKRVLSGVLTEGYNPHDHLDRVRRGQLERCLENMKILTAKKGYHPK